VAVAEVAAAARGAIHLLEVASGRGLQPEQAGAEQAKAGVEVEVVGAEAQARTRRWLWLREAGGTRGGVNATTAAAAAAEAAAAATGGGGASGAPGVTGGRYAGVVFSPPLVEEEPRRAPAASHAPAALQTIPAMLPLIGPQLEPSGTGGARGGAGSGAREGRQPYRFCYSQPAEAGLEVLMAAWGEVRARRPNASLVVLGCSPSAAPSAGCATAAAHANASVGGGGVWLAGELWGDALATTLRRLGLGLVRVRVRIRPNPNPNPTLTLP